MKYIIFREKNSRYNLVFPEGYNAWRDIGIFRSVPDMVSLKGKLSVFLLPCLFMVRSPR
jgi:hypothetical protein